MVASTSVLDQGEHEKRSERTSRPLPAGGSFLNHQWLIAGATPTWPDAPVANHSIIDSNGMPTATPLYTPTGPELDRQLTQLCPSLVPNRAGGDYAVNTIQ